MSEEGRQNHWESIYQANDGKVASWFQAIPKASLELMADVNLPAGAHIIDIGGGDSLFVDHVLAKGYDNVSVLDISSAALERAKNRLGNSSEKVQWITSDITGFEPTEKYDLWHDRAAFHFLTYKQDISRYMDILNQCVNPGGVVIMGTFSTEGPTQCSGLPIRQYSERTLTKLFMPTFEKVKCITLDHETPGGSKQNFLFCMFRKIG